MMPGETARSVSIVLPAGGSGSELAYVPTFAEVVTSSSAAAGCSEDLVLLSEDCVLTPRWLDGLLRAREATGAAAVGPRSNFAPGPQGGVWLDDVSPAGIEEIADGFNHHDPTRWFEVERLSAFALLVGREWLERAGGLGKADLSLRIAQAGGKLVCAGDTFVYRSGSVEVDGDEPTQPERALLSRLLGDESGRLVMTPDGAVHGVRDARARRIVGDPRRVRRLPLVRTVPAERLTDLTVGDPIAVEAAVGPVPSLPDVLPSNPAIIEPERLTPPKDVIADLREAIQAGRTYSMIRLGSGEALSLNHDTWPVEGFPLVYAGRGRVDAETLSRELRRATRMADVVGVQERRDLPFCAPLLERLLFHYDLYPRARCTSDINFHLIGVDPETSVQLEPSPLHEMLTGRRVAVIGRRADEARTRADELGIDIRHAYGLESLDEIDDVYASVAAARQSFDIALLACGLSARILAPRLARELEIVAIDVGHALDRMLNPRYTRANIAYLKNRWWMHQYIAELAAPAPEPPHEYEGRLVRAEGSPKVFLVERGRRRQLLHREFLALFDDKPIQVDAGIVDALPDGPPLCIVRERLTGAYVLIAGVKHRVSPLFDVLELDELALDAVPDGPDRQSWPMPGKD